MCTLVFIHRQTQPQASSGLPKEHKFGRRDREREGTVIFKLHIFESKFLKERGGESQDRKDFITNKIFKRRQNLCSFLVRDLAIT